MPSRRKRSSSKPQRTTIGGLWASITVKDMILGAAATAAVLVAISSGYEKAEPVFPVLHYQMRDYGDGLVRPLKTSDVETKSILRDLQIENAERNRQATMNAQEQLKVQLNNPVVQKDRDLKDSLNRQYMDNQGAINRLDAQINVLRDIKNKGQ